MDFTDDGIEILSSDEHSEKADLSIVIIDDGSEIFFNNEHLQKV